MTEAVVYIGKINKADVIKEYYTRCGLEMFKPNVRIPVKAILNYVTFEDLIDKMLTRSEWVHLVVSHGSPDGGLLMPLASGGGHNQTGKIMDDLAVLAETQMCLRTDAPNYSGRIKFIADGMGVKPAVVTRVAEKLGMLQRKSFIVEIRGCNIGKEREMLGRYRRAFGHMTSAPNCRMFYLRIEPGRPPRGKAMDDLKIALPTTPKTRRRYFSDPAQGAAGPIIIDIADIDGHTNVRPAGFMQDPHKASEWANRLLSTWKQAPAGAGSNRFVLPVMWDDEETTFHLPLEPGFGDKLVMVP
jgi:hypothetical protein